MCGFTSVPQRGMSKVWSPLAGRLGGFFNAVDEPPPEMLKHVA